MNWTVRKTCYLCIYASRKLINSSPRQLVNSLTRQLVTSFPKKPYMLLVLLLSYVNLFQRTLLLSPRRMFHFRFILESGCKSTNFTTNFQIFFKKSFRNLQKLIYIKGGYRFFSWRVHEFTSWQVDECIRFLVDELTSWQVDELMSFRVFLKHVNNAAIYIQ